MFIPNLAICILGAGLVQAKPLTFITCEIINIFPAQVI